MATIAPRTVGAPTTAESNNAVVTTLTLARPSGLQDGDILVAALRCGSSSQTTDATFSPAFTRRGLGFSASSSTVRVTGVFTRYVAKAADEPASYTVTLAGNSFARMVAELVIVRVGDGAQAWGAEPTYLAPTGFAGGPPAYPNALTGVPDNGLAIHVHGNEIVSPNATSWTPPAGTTSIGIRGSVTDQTATGATRSVIAMASEVTSGGSVGGSGKTGVFPSYSSPAAALLVIPGTEAAPVVTPTPTPLAAWLARPGPKWVGHRTGHKDRYGEFTLKGYAALAAWNRYAAWNIDVVRTADGVFVASHDLTTGRILSGASLAIGSSNWADISGKTTLVGGNPVARLEDIVALAPPRTVFFIDNKANVLHSALATKLATLGLTPANTVYKVGASSTGNLTSARANGYTTWAYAFDADVPALQANAASIDWIGFDHAGTQASWDAVVALGKPSLAHIIATPAQRAAADAKVAAAGGTNFGFMVTDVPAVVPPATNLSLWDGTTERPLAATWWTGTAERPVTAAVA